MKYNIIINSIQYYTTRLNQKKILSIIGSTQYYTTRLNRGGDAQRKRKKLPGNLKNWYKAENGGKVLN